MNVQLEHLIKREWTERVPPTCPACGYDLRGLPELRCPECGCRPTFKELKEAARHTTALLADLEQVRQNLRVGWRIAAAGTIALVTLWMIGMNGLVLIGGTLCGIGMVGTGLQAFRVTRIPSNTRLALGARNELTAGAALAGCGLLLFAVAIVIG